MGDLRTTTGEKRPATTRERRSRTWRVVGSLVVALGAIWLLGAVIRVPRYAPARGYVTTAGYAEVRAATTGVIIAIPATSGDVVEEGDALVRLEDGPERAMVGEARTQVAKGEAELVFREAAAAENRRQHADRVRMAEMELDHARQRLEVTTRLHERGLASGRQLSEDKYGVTRGEEALRALRDIDLSVEERQVEVFRREVETRRDALKRAEANLALKTIRAPRSGRVVRYTFYTGELVRPDMVLYEIFDGDVETMKLRVPERYATRVARHMRVEAKLGSYRTLFPTRFYGQVDVLRDVVEGDGANNYRVAYCSLDRRGYNVAPGTSVDARIRIGRSSLWNILLEL